jgi:hypothetical protein
MNESSDEPEWTDVTPSDPGITLLQLFAYLAEALLGFVLVATVWRCGRRIRAAARRKP